MNESVLGAVREKFFGTHILSVAQFSPEELECVFSVVDEFRVALKRAPSLDLLKGRILANLFYESSTRTSSSFAAAMMRLGGSVIAINEVNYSSVAKGESLPDTIRTLETYADIIVLRHHEKGSAALAAEVARKPIINAGDGIGEHPTQALLDLYTIMRERNGKGLAGTHITMLGDLKYGRTVHSLARLLRFYEVTLHFVSPTTLTMPEYVTEELRAAGISFSEHTDIHEVLAESDVLYVTRIQKERFANQDEYQAVNGSYCIDLALLDEAKKDLILMHPFPRVGEIHPAVDSDPRAAYFRQMEYGLFVRMALVALVLGRA